MILSPYELKGYFYLEVIHPDRIPLIAKKMRDFKGRFHGYIEDRGGREEGQEEFIL